MYCSIKDTSLRDFYIMTLDQGVSEIFRFISSKKFLVKMYWNFTFVITLASGASYSRMMTADINCVLLYWRHLPARLLYNDFGSRCLRIFQIHLVKEISRKNVLKLHICNYSSIRRKLFSNDDSRYHAMWLMSGLYSCLPIREI